MARALTWAECKRWQAGRYCIAELGADNYLATYELAAFRDAVLTRLWQFKELGNFTTLEEAQRACARHKRRVIQGAA